MTYPPTRGASGAQTGRKNPKTTERRRHARNSISPGQDSSRPHHRSPPNCYDNIPPKGQLTRHSPLSHPLTSIFLRATARSTRLWAVWARMSRHRPGSARGCFGEPFHLANDPHSGSNTRRGHRSVTTSSVVWTFRTTSASDALDVPANLQTEDGSRAIRTDGWLVVLRNVVPQAWDVSYLRRSSRQFHPMWGM